MDIFPTLVELAGLPAVPAAEGLEGTSLVPVLQSPDSAPGKTAAFSQYPRCPQFSMTADPTGWECLEVPKTDFGVMGYSVRTKEARYTEWRTWSKECVADWQPGGLVAAELYSHEGDDGMGTRAFDDFEYENLAYAPELQRNVTELARLLATQFSRATGC